MSTTDLSRLVSYDGRAPIQKLRRASLQRIAAAHDIRYPPDATKDDLIKMLEGHQVDVLRASADISLRWVQTSGQDENGHATSSLWPVEQPHASAKLAPDRESAMAANVREREAEEARRKEEAARQAALAEENAALRSENATLKEMVEARLSALESRGAQPLSDLHKMSYSHIKHIAASLGIKAVGKKSELIAKIEAHEQNPS